jgi:hypothetical protein
MIMAKKLAIFLAFLVWALPPLPGATVGVVHTRLLLLLHPAMAAYDFASGRFFRNLPTDPGQALSTLQEAWNKQRPHLEILRQQQRDLATRRLDLLLQRDLLLQQVHAAKEEAQRKRQAVPKEIMARLRTEEERFDRFVAENEKAERQLERLIHETSQRGLDSFYLSAAESGQRLEGLRQEILALIRQVGQANGLNLLIDNSLGFQPFPFPTDHPAAPHYPEPADHLTLRLFQAFSTWPAPTTATSDEDRRTREGRLATALGLTGTELGVGKNHLVSSLGEGLVRHSGGSLIVAGARDITPEVAARMFSTYRIPAALQNTYQIFLRDFLALDRTHGYR